MSLKGFHLFFIGCSAILAVVFGLWLLDMPPATPSSLLTPGPMRIAGAVGAFTIAIALIGYEAWFIRYLRRRPS